MLRGSNRPFARSWTEGVTMTTSVKLPQWGMSMAEGTLTQWFVAEGDEVTAGQDLVEVEAAKVTDTVTAPAGGVVGPLLVPEGETVKVNTVLVELYAEGATSARSGPSAEPVEATPPASPARPVEAPTSAPDSVARDPAAARSAAGRVTGVVPLARKLAKENGIDLQAVSGTGTNGRIVVSDIEAAIAQASAPMEQNTAASAASGTKLTSMRRVIGERMTESLRNSAQLTLTTTVDVTDFAQLRETVGGGVRKPGYVDAVIRACALALREHPGVGAQLDSDQLVQPESVNVGMAVALDDGLVVPVIRDADRLGLAETGARVLELAEAARAGSLSPDDYAGGTFTVTSLGGQGIDAFTPILNPPQSAILGVGRSREVPVRFGNGFAWRQEMTLSLTVDHRVVDGYPGALFLQDVVRMLERPRELL